VSGASGTEFAEVLEFWFGDSAHADPQTIARRFEWWFRGGTDEEILRRFTALHARAVAGELESWSREPLARLALILVLDQFSRTVHRGSAQAFAQDAEARTLTLEGIENGHYAALATPWQKTFFFLPLGHSEELMDLERAVALAEELARNAAPGFGPLLEHSAAQARGHRDVVARFGRQPHRNAVLGRVSTPEELAYLERGELVHQRSLPASLTGW
jgi:uncharacterized protein (DUF924 family)